MPAGRHRDQPAYGRLVQQGGTDGTADHKKKHQTGDIRTSPHARAWKETFQTALVSSGGWMSQRLLFGLSCGCRANHQLCRRGVCRRIVGRFVPVHVGHSAGHTPFSRWRWHHQRIRGPSTQRTADQTRGERSYPLRNSECTSLPGACPFRSPPDPILSGGWAGSGREPVKDQAGWQVLGGRPAPGTRPCPSAPSGAKDRGWLIGPSVCVLWSPERPARQSSGQTGPGSAGSDCRASWLA